MGGGRLFFMSTAAATAAAFTTVAHAQQSPPPPPPAAGADASGEAAVQQEDPVVVLAPGDQVRIDRRTYTLRDDPAAQSSDMFDVLGRIPSVSVAPSGAVTLLGASGVTIQLNGQPVASDNLEQVLRGITGAEVERIEVITNPSAQYSAAASGGIINIITRQRVDTGFNGSVQARADTLGAYSVNISPSWSRGPWSLSGGLAFWDSEQQRDSRRERTILSSGVTTLEEGDQETAFNGYSLSRLQLGYRPTTRRRFMFTLNHSRRSSDLQLETETTEGSAPLSNQSNVSTSDSSSDGVIFDFQQDGARPRELLRANVALRDDSNEIEQTFAFAPIAGTPSQFMSTDSSDNMSANARLEYERPLAGDRFLTVGIALDSSDNELETTRQTLVGPAIPPDYATRLDGRQDTQAAFGMFQFRTGDWTWQPGLRAENYRREVISSGAETDDVDLRAFPSIHIRRELGDHIHLDLSYTSRIRRPGLFQLDPALRFFDVNRASSGNPDLQPSLVDAYEMNLTYQNAGRSLSLTFYDRISEDVFSRFTETLIDGTILTTTVNAGTSEERGVQAILRGPLGQHWRYSANVNVLEREFDSLSGGVLSRRSELEYGGSARLEYRDADQNAVGADQLQFELRFGGPRHELQSDADEFIFANFTWRRKLTERVYATLTAEDIFSTQGAVSEITTDTFFERTESESLGAIVRLALTYQFGNGPQRPPQDEDQSGPPPMQ